MFKDIPKVFKKYSTKGVKWALFLKGVKRPSFLERSAVLIGCTTDFRCLPKGNEITIASVRHYREQIGHPGSVSSDLATSRNHEIGSNRIYIVLKYDRRSAVILPKRLSNFKPIGQFNKRQSRALEIIFWNLMFRRPIWDTETSHWSCDWSSCEVLSAHALVVQREDLFECVQNRTTTQNSAEYQVIFNIGNVVRHLDISSAILNYVTSWKQ